MQDRETCWGVNGNVREPDVQVASMAGTMAQRWEGVMGNPRIQVSAP